MISVSKSKLLFALLLTTTLLSGIIIFSGVALIDSLRYVEIIFSALFIVQIFLTIYLSRVFAKKDGRVYKLCTITAVIGLPLTLTVMMSLLFIELLFSSTFWQAYPVNVQNKPLATNPSHHECRLEDKLLSSGPGESHVVVYVCEPNGIFRNREESNRQILDMLKDINRYKNENQDDSYPVTISWDGDIVTVGLAEGGEEKSFDLKEY